MKSFRKVLTSPYFFLIKVSNSCYRNQYLVRRDWNTISVQWINYRFSIWPPHETYWNVGFEVGHTLVLTFQLIDPICAVAVAAIVMAST